MHNHQREVGDRTSLGRRHGSRKRDSPDFFVPTPFRPSPQLHGQGLRHGPGRPPKQRPDAESSASQPLRRGPGRPQRKRSDVLTNAPEVVLPPPVPPTGSSGNIPEQVSVSTNSVIVPPPVPPTGSNENIPEQVSMSTNSVLVPPPPVPPTGSKENIPEQVLMSTNSELVPPPPVPPLGSISDTPLLIPCDEEDGQRETMLKPSPLSRLKTPKQRPSQSQVPEKSKKLMTDAVYSVLVPYFTSGTVTSVDDMVTFANSGFSALDWGGADDGSVTSLYEDVKKMISYKYDLFIAEREGAMCSVSELEKQRLDAVLRAYNIEKEIEHAQAKQEKDKEDKEQLKREIQKARELFQRLEQLIPELEQQVAAIDQEEKCLKDDEQKHRAAHRIAQAEVEKVSTQTNEARAVQMDIERRKNEALQGVESTKRRLLSYIEER